MKEKNKESMTTSRSVSYPQSLLVHLVCGLGVAVPWWVGGNLFSLTLVSDPSSTLRLIWVAQSVVVLLVYSLFRQNPDQCSYLRAVGRGILALPVGALANAFGAIVLGAPVGSQYLLKTINWSLFMSSLTCVPTAAIFGSSWKDWQRIFAHTKPNGSLEYMICIPACGAVVGGWFGAFPMPLDWERPWQEWPICVTYGAIIGYIAGMAVSFGFVLAHGRRHHLKGE